MKISNVLSNGAAGIGLVLLVIAVICLGPMVFLWSVNSLAAAGGSDFYIPHGLWNYSVTLVLLGVLKAGVGNSSD